MRNIEFLGKDINDINIEDLQEYFSVEQEETSTVEFKSGDVKLEKIFPQICAFLNTNGGILIIGAPNKSENKSKEIYMGDLIPSKIIKSGFILSQKICSYIIPAGLNIKIKELDYKDGKVYVIHVPQSLYPPHQNSLDGIYYIRLESETTKAPHGLIQAMFNKRQYANLVFELKYYNDENSNRHIKFEIRNESLITAIKGGYMIDIFGVKSFKKTELTKNIQQYKNVNIVYEKNEVVSNSHKNSFSFQDKFKTLNKGLYLFHDFIVETFDSYFLINLVTWAKDTELKQEFYVINPNNDSIIFQSNENVNNLEELFMKYKINCTVL